MDPCCLCGDTDGDCRCSLPEHMPATDIHEIEVVPLEGEPVKVKVDLAGPAVDHEQVYAEYLDDLCEDIQICMTTLRERLGHCDFMITMQQITKEVIKDA